MSDQFRINGNMVSWASISLSAGINKYTGFNSITYGDKRERVEGYGMGRSHAPRGRSAGKYSTEVSKLRGPKSTIEALRSDLALLSPDQRSYGNIEFVCSVRFIEVGDTIMNVVLHKCVLITDMSQHEESPDPLFDEIEIKPLYIVRNGKTLFDSTMGLP